MPVRRKTTRKRRRRGLADFAQMDRAAVQIQKDIAAEERRLARKRKSNAASNKSELRRLKAGCKKRHTFDKNGNIRWIWIDANGNRSTKAKCTTVSSTAKKRRKSTKKLPAGVRINPETGLFESTRRTSVKRAASKKAAPKKRSAKKAVSKKAAPKKRSAKKAAPKKAASKKRVASKKRAASKAPIARKKAACGPRKQRVRGHCRKRPKRSTGIFG